jgi:tRNA uridine 5-carbamoylmethylation protein Kti12
MTLQPTVGVGVHKNTKRAVRTTIAEQRLLHNERIMALGSSRRQYIRDFDKIVESSKTARELYDQMLKLHPDGSNPHILWLGALAAKN